MKSKPKHLAKRILVFLLTLSILWSESSFVSLAQTINGEATESFQGIFYEEPSEGSEAEITEITEGETEPGKPEGDPADLEGDSEDPEDGLGDPKEDLEEAGNPEEEPAEEPVEAPEDAEEPEDSEESEDSEELSEEVENEEVKYDAGTVDTGKLAFRIGDANSDWNGGDVPGDSVIKIYNNADENPGYLKQDDVEDIVWYANWLPEDNYDSIMIGSNVIEMDLSTRFNPFEAKIWVEITLSGGEKHTMTLDHVGASLTEDAPNGVKLEGTAMPGYTLSLTGEHTNVEGNYYFIRDDDGEGTNAICVICNETSYTIDDAGNGKYIYTKYAVWDEEGNGTFYKTQPVYVGYRTGDVEADKKANAELLQKAIDKAAEDASRTGNQKDVNIPAGVRIIADEPIILYDGVTLNADNNSYPAIIGSIQVKKYKAGAKPVGEARIENLYLSLDSEDVTAIDASSDVCVVLNNCRFDINKNATLLKVSKDNYAGTKINNSIAYFSKDGALLSMKEDPSMPSVFKLGNTDLRVKVEGNDKVVMNSSTGVKWNVNGLSPESMDSLVKLTPDNVINNVFWMPGWTSNSKELTVDSAYNNYISYTLADGSSFTAEDAKIIVEPNNNPAGKYEVTDIPKPEGLDNFRPYAVTGTYTAGTGDYKNLLPKNYLTYIVVDVNQRSGFPYGALVGKEINLPNYEDFVVMQYHKDKSVETVASIVGKEVESSNYNSGFAGIEYLGSGKYKLLVNTKVKGEDVAEPIVLAVYANAKASGVKLSVYEEEIYYDNADTMRQEFPSDGKILTDGDKTVYFRLNEGVVNNAFGKDGAFEIMSGGYTVPDEQDISKVVSENGAKMTLTIPEGTYGTLTVKAHYKGSAAEKATDFTYKLQLTTIDNIEGVTVDYVNSGKQYYGTATFEVLSGEAKPFLSVKSGNGENSRYNFKVISSSLSGKTVTVQYMLDLRSENGEAWESFALNPPCLLVETVAGICEIYFNSGEDKLSVEKDGVRYLFDKIENKNEVVFTGALIINGGSYYRQDEPTKLDIPGSVKVGETTYTVTAMVEGCLNNIFDNGNRVYAPNVVIIPAGVTDIRVPMVTDKSYSHLSQIVVDDNNKAYCTYGKKEDFDSTDRDNRKMHDYCALYKKNNDGTTELVEIASDWGEHLSWRGDAVWTDDTYNLDFSNIKGFACNDSTKGYQTLNGNDRILVKIEDNSVTLIKVLEKIATGTAVVIPEDVTNINARALENIAVDTLVLPSTMKSWDGGLTKAKNIYVYNEDTTINPVSGIADSVKGVTFYGFTDEKGNSELKTWVTANAKARNYKFVAMKKTGAEVDYTVTTLRTPVMSYEGKEYYEVNIGERLTPDFDFDIVSKVKNGYPGKTDVHVEVVGEDGDYTKVTNEFGEPFCDENGNRWIEAQNPGVVKVKIMKGDKEVKTAYFAVRPDWVDDSAIFEGVENPWDGLGIELGETGTVYLPVRGNLSEDVLKEYEALGVLRVKLAYTLVGDKTVDGHDAAWNIKRKTYEDDSNRIAYNFKTQLCNDGKGNIIGGGGTLFEFGLFGKSYYSQWCSTMYWGKNGSSASWQVENIDGNIFMDMGNKTISLPVVMTVNYPERLPDNFKPENISDKDDAIGKPIEGQKGNGYLSYVHYDNGEEEWTILEDKAYLTFDGDDTKYSFISCEVISGKDIVNAEIVGDSEGSNLRLTAKKAGKAQIRLYSKYSWIDEYLTVTVGKAGEELVQKIHLQLWEDTWLDSTNDPTDDGFRCAFVKDKKVAPDDDKYEWEHVIPVNEINDDSGPIPSSKLKWTVSDSNLAVLVKGDTKDKNKVTGIQLKDEGTVRISVTVQDTNAANINMLFTVKDIKPRLYNTNASLDSYKQDGKAEYVFALPEDVGVERAELVSVKLNNKGDDVKDKFGLDLDGFDVWKYNENTEEDEFLYRVNDRVLVGINDSLAAGTYTLQFAVTSTYYVNEGEGEEGEGEAVENSENGEADESKNITGTYYYTVTLKLTGTAPKVTVTAADAIDLSIPSKRESALTVTVGDVVNGKNTTIEFDENDTLTKSFAEYFKLVKPGSDAEESESNDEESGVYSIRFTKNNEKTAAEIAKLFNGKKIKLQVTSADYKNFKATVQVSLKITATTPAIKVDGGGKVTVNTTNFAAYEYRDDNNEGEGDTDDSESDEPKNQYGVYTSGTSYTLTDGFELLSGANDEEGNDAVIKMEIAKNQAAYQDMITFRKEGDRIIAMVDPRVPKGTYTFTWTPEVRAFSDDIVDNIFTNIPLKSQKISVVVTTSTAKAALSSTKLVLDRNYIYSGPRAALQFDENQIQSLYGSSYRFGGIDNAKTADNITLVSAPKGVSLNDSGVWTGAWDNGIGVGIYDFDGVKPGEYKYSVTPYVIVKTDVEDEEGKREVHYPMALAPISFSVQVTDKLPTATLSQTTVTMDNNMANRVYLKWNIKGNYKWIAGSWDVAESNEDSPEFKYSYENGNAPENGPIVYLEGDDIRIQADENTLKGTYKISITPQVVLDEDWQEPYDKNIVPLAPVTLTVKVNDARPAVKLEKSKLTVNSTYPGLKDTDNNGWFVNVPAEAVTEINTSNGYAIGNIEVKAADNNAKAIQENENTKITFSQGKDGGGVLHCFAAIPTADTPNGTYNFLLYAWQHDGGKPDNKGQALEPVKLQVIVKNAKPTLKLSIDKDKNTILLPAGREGRADITLQGQTDLVSGIKKKTEYLVKENGKWILKEVENNEQVPDNAYARLDTADDGRITVTSLGKSDTVSNAKVTYIQETCLIGNKDSDGNKSYNASYSYNLIFNLTSAAPKIVLSANTITVNKNYREWDQEGNQVKLTLNNREKIVRWEYVDTNKGNKNGIIAVTEKNAWDEGGNYIGNDYEKNLCVYFEKPDNVVTGNYTFNLIPYVETAGKEKALSPVKLTVNITAATPTVKASATKVTINKLDRRGNTQQIHLKPSLPYADVQYDVAVTKGPKGVDPMDIDFCQDGWQLIHNEGDLNLGPKDSEIPDGAYTVTVTPYTRVGGKRKDLNKINIAVTVTSPKVTAAVQSPKMTIDVATADNVYMKNAIMLTGTNADCVNKLYWDWKLTKKPKGAVDEIWLEDRWNEGDETDGREFAVCWGDRRDDDNKYVNVIPGVYEFTITPTGVETHDDNVSVPTPAPVKVTVTVKNSMPTVKYGKTTSKMNMAFLNEDNTFITLSDTSWNLEYVDAVMTSWPKGAGEEDKSGLSIDLYWDEEAGRLKVRGSDRVMEGTYTFTLEPHVRNRNNGIEMSLKEQKYTVTVKNEIPTVKVSSAKLTCNVLYTGKYGFGDNIKQQLKLTLNKNYGPSHFENCKITFTGKAAQQADADKMDWQFNPGDGTVAVRLKEGRVANKGNYTFELTPSIRSDLTGVKMTLKPVKITVTVENKAIKATAKASGSIDLVNRDGSGITYTVTLSDKDADVIEWIEIVPPEKGEDESGNYYLEQDEENPAKVIVRLRNDDNKWGRASTKKNYEMRLAVHTRYEMTYYVPIKIKPTQSALTANANAVTLYKQATYDTAAVTEIKMTSNGKPFDVKFTWHEGDEFYDGRLVTGNPDFKAYLIDAEDPEWIKNDEGEDDVFYVKYSDSTKVKIVFASEYAKSKYKAGQTVKVPVYLSVFNMDSNMHSTIKAEVTVKIQN